MEAIIGMVHTAKNKLIVCCICMLNGLLLFAFNNDSIRQDETFGYLFNNIETSIINDNLYFSVEEKITNIDPRISNTLFKDRGFEILHLYRIAKPFGLTAYVIYPSDRTGLAANYYSWIIIRDDTKTIYKFEYSLSDSNKCLFIKGDNIYFVRLYNRQHPDASSNSNYVEADICQLKPRSVSVVETIQCIEYSSVKYE